MIGLIRQYIPHAPKLGLFVTPSIPPKKLHNAIDDYASHMDPSEVLALFDATLIGSARDGMVLAADRVVFQNHNLEAPQEIRYSEIVEVGTRRGPFRGTRLVLHVNRGHATFETELNVSAKPEVARYLRKFFEESMLRPDTGDAMTDWVRVTDALEALHQEGSLSDPDLRRLLGDLYT